MALTAELLLRRGDFTLDASVRVAAGETLALLGPNGSGKSTMLAAIAGLLAPERGIVEVNGRTITNVGGTVRATAVEPHERKVGLLGQDPLLFPHLTALENIAFGMRARGDSATSARQAASVWLEAMGLSDFASRMPTQLSGGQQQRVAIARALAAEPDVLLLDEPMAALDVQNASAVRTLLRKRLGATALPTIVVSHDVVDAMVLADRVAIMDDGRIVDIGEPAIVLGQPKNLFAANLVGLNLVHGTLGSDGTIHTDDGRRMRGRIVDVAPASTALKEGDAVIAAFPPSAVRLSLAEAERTEAGRTEATRTEAGRADIGRADADAFSWRATVGVLEPAVGGIRVPFTEESYAAELTTAELLASGVREGMSVTVTVDPQLVTVYRPRNDARSMQR